MMSCTSVNGFLGFSKRKDELGPKSGKRELRYNW